MVLWYHIDVTWDDPVPDKQNEVRYNYFLLSDEQLAEDHEWDRTQYPVANREYDSPTTSENSALVLHDLMLYVKAKGMSRLKGFSDYRAKFLAVVKNTIYDGSFSKVDKLATNKGRKHECKISYGYFVDAFLL